MEVISFNEIEKDAEIGFMHSDPDAELDMIVDSRITAHVHAMGALMLERMDLHISEELYPSVYVRPDALSALAMMIYDRNGSEFHVQECITLPGGHLDGNITGEEMIHWIQLLIRKNAAKDPSSDLMKDQWLEFVGFLGRRILYDLALRQHFSYIFPDGIWDIFERADALHILRDIRSQLRKLDQLQISQKNFDLQQILMKQRYDMITHQRSYEFAAECDWERIQNWHVFLSLPATEGVRRFFRKPEDQDFSGLENDL